jgi:hypothetical protein
VTRGVTVALGAGAVLLVCSVAAAGKGDEAAESGSVGLLRRWSGPSAFTVPKGRFETGLFSTSRYGVSDRLELGVHPVLFFALPHVEAKWRYADLPPFALAARGRMSYPATFLALVSREGSGGLLPETSEPPFALMLEADAVVTGVLQSGSLASLSLGFAVAPHTSVTRQELPLLDFPFLYPRFAALYSPIVPRAQLNVESVLFLGFYLELELRGYLLPSLPYVGTALAFEQALALEYRFGDSVAVSLGTRLAEAEYPVGQRWHVLPHANVRVGF